jgi:phosphoserine phosphatase
MPIYALVLTSPPERPSLSTFAVARAWRLIPSIQQRSQRWLSHNEAWEAEFGTNEGQTVAEIRQTVRQALLGLTVDINVVTGDAQARRKKLLIADMDSTIIQQECIDEMADVIGIKPRIAAITERAMRGELKFEEALRERLMLLAGLTEGQLQRIADDRVHTMPGARTLVATMRANGAYTALVSGGFTYFTSRIRERVGFDADHANILEMDGARMTGKVAGPILGQQAKLDHLETYKRQRGLQQAETLAVGDGANDLAMIRAAGLGVAYRAKPIVAAEADSAISHGDLTSLLFLQGYQREEFVE